VLSMNKILLLSAVSVIDSSLTFNISEIPLTVVTITLYIILETYIQGSIFMGHVYTLIQVEVQILYGYRSPGGLGCRWPGMRYQVWCIAL